MCTASRARGAKAVSIRRLIRHPGLGMSRSRVWVCIGVYVQACVVPSATLEGLSLSHRELLLGVDVRDVEQLAARCRVEGWTAAALRGEVGRMRRARRTRPTRRLIAALETVVAEIDLWDGVTDADRIRALIVQVQAR